MDRTQITRAVAVLEAPVPGVQELLLHVTSQVPAGMAAGDLTTVANLSRTEVRTLWDELGAWLLETDEGDPRYLMVVHPEANAVVKTRKNGDDVITLEWRPDMEDES